jgi:hypothetical protein
MDGGSGDPVYIRYCKHRHLLAAAPNEKLLNGYTEELRGRFHG